MLTKIRSLWKCFVTRSHRDVLPCGHFTQQNTAPLEKMIRTPVDHKNVLIFHGNFLPELVVSCLEVSTYGHSSRSSPDPRALQEVTNDVWPTISWNLSSTLGPHGLCEFILFPVSQWCFSLTDFPLSPLSSSLHEYRNELFRKIPPYLRRA